MRVRASDALVSPLTDRAPCRHSPGPCSRTTPPRTDAAFTFNAVRDVVDSVESSFDSVYETVKSGSVLRARGGRTRARRRDEEEGQVELEPAEAPPPDRRRAILQYDDEYYSDYFAAAPEAAVEDYDYGEAGAGPVGAPAPAPGPYGG